MGTFLSRKEGLRLLEMLMERIDALEAPDPKEVVRKATNTNLQYYAGFEAGKEAAFQIVNALWDEFEEEANKYEEVGEHHPTKRHMNIVGRGFDKEIFNRPSRPKSEKEKEKMNGTKTSR
jgi:hypothetical protein